MMLIRDERSEDAQHVVAVLYAFAEKFMKDPKELERLKGVMLMTRLAQMLFDEGLEQGRELGLEQGRELGLEQGRELGLEQGRKLGLELINQLNTMLLKDNRINDLKKASSDTAYQRQLIKEYRLDETL